MDNTIVISVDYGDNEIEINTDNIRLTMEELNLLADKLWRYNWEIDCELVATNNKHSPYWVFGLFPSANLKSIAEDVRVIVQNLFPDKFVKVDE